MTAAAPDARLLSTAIKTPPHRLSQTAVRDLCRDLFADSAPGLFERLAPVYLNAGVETRYACAPIGWYRRPHGWAERAALFDRFALDLLEDAAWAALDQAGLGAADVDQIVCVTTTGVSTPSLEARLAERMAFRADVRRTPLFGLGCAGGALGLARAADLARARPGETVLLLAVELCTLTFRPQVAAKETIVASALFGDAAGAAVIRAGDAQGGDAQGGGAQGAALGPAGEHRWPESLDVMGWEVADDGLGVIFSQAIPTLIDRDLPPALDGFLQRAGLARADIAHWLLHPGGAKVLAAYERAFDLPSVALAETRSVLRRMGNCSSVGVLAVLDRARADGASGCSLIAALGPGFTAGFQLIDL
ncbi:MAG: type III polyketide synthase [Marivibrio sp.]|uniref:type III polyketide synthase n=1 Tax=Marivibrio sp. TaxID=2039719 RepID=UPI0032EE3BA1